MKLKQFYFNKKIKPENIKFATWPITYEDWCLYKKILRPRIQIKTVGNNCFFLLQINTGTVKMQLISIMKKINK